MRILTWNINGIRTLPQFHPWNTLKEGDAILDELNAQIICFQEMKCQRSSLEKTFAIPSKYDSFFSFPVTKGGYSGVAVYSKKALVAPIKAEEGLTGRLQPKPPLTDEERITSEYPKIEHLNFYPDENDNVPRDLFELDNEGRTLVVDFGLFVLINLYCPAETSETRLPYKMNFHLLLQERVRLLIEEGREVIVVGDINITAAPIDHCDGNIPSQRDDFWGRPARAWLRDWLEPTGPMVDVIRNVWPNRQGMYTCWNTKISARAVNYGTRIDYILLTKGLLPWFKHGDIQPTIHGSDHCPVFVDLHDEIQLPSGEMVKIRDAMRYDDAKRQPPRISAAFWIEFKQKLLSNFFTSKKSAVNVPQPSPWTSTSSTTVTQLASQTTASMSDEIESTTIIASQEVITLSHDTGERDPPSLPVSQSIDDIAPVGPKPNPEQPNRSGSKRTKQLDEDTGYVPKKKKQKVGQSRISSFFASPSVASPSSSGKSGPSRSRSSQNIIDVDSNSETAHSTPDNFDQMEEDRRLALSLSEGDLASSTKLPSNVKNSTDTKSTWNQLFAPIQPPRCTIHNEPCVQYTVNKTGLNKGKTFWICSKPVGPGYDKGSERRREEIDLRYRCNFFKWTTDLKKETKKNRSGGSFSK